MVTTLWGGPSFQRHRGADTIHYTGVEPDGVQKKTLRATAIRGKGYCGPERSSHFCTHRHHPVVIGCYLVSEAVSLTVLALHRLGRLRVDIRLYQCRGGALLPAVRFT